MISRQVTDQRMSVLINTLNELAHGLLDFEPLDDGRVTFHPSWDLEESAWPEISLNQDPGRQVGRELLRLSSLYLRLAADFNARYCSEREGEVD